MEKKFQSRFFWNFAINQFPLVKKYAREPPAIASDCRAPRFKGQNSPRRGIFAFQFYRQGQNLFIA
jgi:hypothetical protein